MTLKEGKERWDYILAALAVQQKGIDPLRDISRKEVQFVLWQTGVSSGSLLMLLGIAEKMKAYWSIPLLVAFAIVILLFINSISWALVAYHGLMEAEYSYMLDESLRAHRVIRSYANATLEELNEDHKKALEKSHEEWEKNWADLKKQTRSVYDSIKFQRRCLALALFVTAWSTVVVTIKPVWSGVLVVMPWLRYVTPWAM